MGSIIELNDTLQLTSEQGFPVELDLVKHKQKPFTASDFAGRVFEFRSKPDIRVFQQMPVRVFLVENIEGKWLYWGLVQVLAVTHDYVKKTTAGKYKIIYLYTPEEMAQAWSLLDRRPEEKY